MSAGPKSVLALHAKIIDALSPTSGVYGVLWPVIVNQGVVDFRVHTLRNVNHYLRSLCDMHVLSDVAIQEYKSYHDRAMHIPYTLDVAFVGTEWRCWTLDSWCFATIKDLDHFLALGNINPYSMREWQPSQLLRHSLESGALQMSDVWSSSMWASESRDVLFEMIIKTLDRTCLIKVIGRADKAMLMYNYIQGMIAASDTGGTINLKILGQKEA